MKRWHVEVHGVSGAKASEPVVRRYEIERETPGEAIDRAVDAFHSEGRPVKFHRAEVSAVTDSIRVLP